MIWQQLVKVELDQISIESSTTGGLVFVQLEHTWVKILGHECGFQIRYLAHSLHRPLVVVVVVVIGVEEIRK